MGLRAELAPDPPEGEPSRARAERQSERDEPPPDPRNPNNPAWLQKAFIGEFGDNYVGDTELEGGQTGPSIRYLLQMALLAIQQRSTLLPLFSDEETAKLQAVLDHLEEAADGGDAMAAVPRKGEQWGPSFTSLLKSIRSQFESLLPGELLVVQGGWVQQKGGHAIMYIVERTSEEEYSFVVLNTGDGIQYHPWTAADYPKEKCRTAIRIDHIPRARLLDEAVLYTIFKMQTTNSDDNKLEILYEVVLPHLARVRLSDGIAQEDPYAEWETPQRAGVCYYRCILTTIRYLMRRQGLSQGHVKQFLHALRRGFLVRTEADLKGKSALYRSHLQLVKLA